MPTRQLPTRLEQEPLVEAIFEVRLGGDPHIAEILPGFIFGRIEDHNKPVIQRLPAADIPKPIRDQDPRMAFQPVTRLETKEFMLSFGERSLMVGCKLPYPKWSSFKDEIIRIVKLSSAAGIAGPVERYSLKYVNIINSESIKNQLSKINMSVKLGEVEVSDEHVSVQVYHKEEDTQHIMTVVTSAQVLLANGQSVSGVILDIDSIRTTDAEDFASFAENFEPAIESLRQQNKEKFFSCLTEETIREMGPSYD